MSTHNIPFLNIKGTRERVRTSHGKQAISVRAIEVLLYIQVCSCSCNQSSKNCVTHKIVQDIGEGDCFTA